MRTRSRFETRAREPRAPPRPRALRAAHRRPGRAGRPAASARAASGLGRRAPLVHRPAAVDDDRLAGDEGGCVTPQEDDGVADVLRRPTPLQALLLEDPVAVLLRVRVDLLRLGREGAR